MRNLSTIVILSNNVTVERNKFTSRRQGADEPVDRWVTELKILARSCEYGALEDSLIKDQIVKGINSVRLRERLMKEDYLDTQKAIKIIRAAELA